jgi:hypothetical protein
VGMSAQAYTTHGPSRYRGATLLRKQVRSSSLGKILARSMPRLMTWDKVPGASRRGCLGLEQARQSLRGWSCCHRTSVPLTV